MIYVVDDFYRHRRFGSKKKVRGRRLTVIEKYLFIKAIKDVLTIFHANDVRASPNTVRLTASSKTQILKKSIFRMFLI